MVMFTGKVTAKAIGRNNPGLAFGTVIFMAAGTAIYDALAARTAKINRLVISDVTKELSMAKIQPFNKGIIKANRNGNNPNEKNDFNFLPLVIPMSNKKMARKPLKRSFVKGLIPSACLALAK